MDRLSEMRFAIAVTTSWPWPARDGVTSKSGNLLSNFPLQVELISDGQLGPVPQGVRVLSPGNRAASTRSRAAYVTAAVRGTLAVQPALASKLVMPLIRDRLAVGRPEFIHLDTMATAHLIKPTREALAEFGHNSPIVISINDSYSLLLRDALATKSRTMREMWLAHVRRVERRLLPLASFVDVVSRTDLAWLKNVSPHANVRVIPLGRPELPTRPEPIPQPLYDVLLFSSPIDLLPFLREFAIRVEGRNLHVALIGRRPNADILHVLDRLGGHYLGFVDDVAQELGRSRLVVAPSQQIAGSSTKAIQAMASGVPVAGGRCLNSLPGVLDGVHCLISEDASTLASSVSSALDQPDLLRNIGEAGRELVSTLPDWDQVCGLYMETLCTGPSDA